MTDGRRVAGFAIAAGACLGVALATAPPGDPFTVTPPHGAADATTTVAISEAAFDPGSRVALRGGGPYLAGAYTLPEGARSVEVHGNRACVAYYSHGSKLGGIQILDVSDPTQPVRVASFETGDSGVGVGVNGAIAYIAFLNPYTFIGGLHVVDVAHPGGPLRLGTFYTFVDPQAMVVDGARVFVADGEDGLRAVDVSDPSNPVDAGAWTSADAAHPGTAHDVVVASGRAYVADGEAGLRIVDVASPGGMAEVGAFAPEGTDILSVVVETDGLGGGARAYVTDRSLGLRVIDVSDPAHPALLSEMALPDVANGLALDGHLLYVAAGVSGLQVVDVTDPQQPRVVGSAGLVGNTSYFFDVTVSDGRAYVADIINGLQVIDVRAPAAPALAGGRDLPGTAVGAALATGIGGDTALVASGDGGLAVLALAADGGLSPRAMLHAPAPVLGVAAVPGTGRALLAAGEAGLLVADVSDPSHPSIVAAAETPGEAQAVAFEAGLAYVADGSQGLAVVDLEGASGPALIGSLDTPGTARGITLAGRTAYVADDFRGVAIVDVTDPSAPVLLSRYDTPGRAYGVAVGGGYAFVADLNRGVPILDVSQPASPRLVTTIGTPGAASGVALIGSRLLVADGFAGVLEFDVSDPRAPVRTGTYDTPGIATALSASLSAVGTVLVADGPRGVRAVRLNPPLPPASPVAEGLRQEIPPGFNPGVYDVQVTTPGGSGGGPGLAAGPILHNGFTVCGIAPLTARLEPSQPPPGAGPSPFPWRLAIEGDDAWFDPGAQRSAMLLLPAIPADPIVLQDSGREAIDIRLPRAGGRASVLLSGSDRLRMQSLWAEFLKQGGVPLPAIDAHNFGPFRLETHPGEGAEGPARYRFELDNGALSAVFTWGPDAHLEFQVGAIDTRGCDRRTSTSP
jgi:hypothetical protein